MKNLHFKNLFKVLFITVCVITALPLTNCIHPLDYSELLEFKASVYPKPTDFVIDGLGTYLCGETYAITVAPKPDMTQGSITIYYEGYNYDKSDTPPTSAGAYTVTFDVGKAKGFYEVSGMVAGSLMINDPFFTNPSSGDFDINGLGPYTLGDTVDVTIEPNPGMTQGHLTIYYERYDYPISETPPSAAGAYTVTFNVEVDEAGQFNAAYGLYAGTLIINNPDPPSKDDFIISGVEDEYKLGDTITVTVEPLDEMLEGKIKIFYEGYNHPRSQTVPSAVGAYTVTFDVAAVEGYSVAAYGLLAGTLIINNNHLPRVEDFEIIGVGEFIVNGLLSQRPVTITPVDSKKDIIKGSVTVYYNGKVSPVPEQFGSYIVTFDVAASLGYNLEVKGLLAGMVIINRSGNLLGYDTPEDPYHMKREEWKPVGGDERSYALQIENTLNANPDKYFALEFDETFYCYWSLHGGLPPKVVSVYIGEGVEEVYNFDFSNSPDLLKVTAIGAGNLVLEWTGVGSGAFHNCPKLQEVYIGNGVSLIGYNTFYNCIGLEKVTIIGNGSATINYGAFNNCTSLKEVTIGDGVTINAYAFLNCTSIEEVTIGNGGTINYGAFLNSTGFRKVIIGDGVTIDSGAFPGDLDSKYIGAGTYTTLNGGITWTKVSP